MHSQYVLCFRCLGPYSNLNSLFQSVLHSAMEQNQNYRVYMANVGFNVTKKDVRQVLEDLGVFSCSEIQVTKIDQSSFIPEHKTYFLDLCDVSWTYCQYV